jgi:hypothetical protein
MRAPGSVRHMNVAEPGQVVFIFSITKKMIGELMYAQK